jgi:hypothetical protein
MYETEVVGGSSDSIEDQGIITNKTSGIDGTTTEGTDTVGRNETGKLDTGDETGDIPVTERSEQTVTQEGTAANQTEEAVVNQTDTSDIDEANATFAAESDVKEAADYTKGAAVPHTPVPDDAPEVATETCVDKARDTEATNETKASNNERTVQGDAASHGETSGEVGVDGEYARQTDVEEPEGQEVTETPDGRITEAEFAHATAPTKFTEPDIAKAAKPDDAGIDSGDGLGEMKVPGERLSEAGVIEDHVRANVIDNAEQRGDGDSRGEDH